jgi:hypothetical protein
VSIGSQDREAEESSTNLCSRILTLLFNNEVVDFQFPTDNTAHANYNNIPKNPFWKKLPSKCPMLEKITCIEFQVHNFEQALFINTLMSMKNLQAIELTSIWFYDSNLITFAEQLPNLR